MHVGARGRPDGSIVDTKNSRIWIKFQYKSTELGGWKSFEMVLRYAHLAPEHLSTAAARIERGLGIVDNDSTISLR